MARIIMAWLFVAATITPALALSVTKVVFTTAEGVSYFWSTTAEGVMFVAPENLPDEQYLLTPDCVVENRTNGTGSWGYEDEGWQISFGNRYQIYFPNQSPLIDPSDCQMLR